MHIVVKQKIMFTEFLHTHINMYIVAVFLISLFKFKFASNIQQFQLRTLSWPCTILELFSIKIKCRCMCQCAERLI